MSLLEWIIVIAVILFASFSVLVIIFRKRKKEGKQDVKPSGESKVEPVYKRDEPPKEQETSEEEKKDVNEGFKIVKRQEGTKINKKALDTQSRNPSVTKVFGKDSEAEKQKQQEQEEQAKIKEMQTAERTWKSKKIEPFFPKDYEYSEVNTDNLFKIVTPYGQPVRTPEINSRSQFGSHLNISEDGNLSGVVGIGLDKALDSAESQLKDIESKNQQMIRRAHGSVNIEDMVDDFDYFERRLMQMREGMDMPSEKSNKKINLKDLDPKSLIVAEAIANPKYKKKKDEQE